MKRLLLLAALVAAGCESQGQNIPRTTPYSRSWLLSTTAAEARDSLGLTGAGAQGRTIYVDSVTGDDDTGEADNMFLPVLTMTRAIELKESGDVIVTGAGTFDFTVTVTAGATTETNRIVSNFAIVGPGSGLATINVIPRGTNEHNRVLSVPNGVSVTNVLFRGFKLDGNASSYAWDTGGKLDWILQGQNITIEDVEVVDFGGHSTQESFTPLFQSSTNCVVRRSVMRDPGSASVTGPTLQDSSRCTIQDNIIEGYNVGIGMVEDSSWNIYTGNRMTNITTAGFLYDTAGSGEIWGNTISRNRFSSSGDGILIGLGAHLDLRIFGNEFFGSNRGINLTNYNASGTNYFLRPVVTENTFYISNGRNVTSVSTTNGAFYLNIGRSTSDNLVSGSSNFGGLNMDRTGAAYSDIPNALSMTGLTVNQGGTITFSGHSSGTPSDAANAWFWLPVVVNGTNAFIRIHQ